MFQEWGFLITEMVMLIILAALLGLVAGWLIWGGSGRAEAADLSACRADGKKKDNRIAALEAELEAARAEAMAAEKAGMLAAEEAAQAADTAAAQAHAEDDTILHELEDERDAARAEALAAEKAAMHAASEAAVAEAVEADQGAHPVHPAQGVRPAALAAPRGGVADDLKEIKGIGPKLETLCNKLGIFHFDQIAAWTEAEIAWVDQNLEGFKGRVSRDGWVQQARLLAAGETTDFAERVKGGKVYE